MAVHDAACPRPLKGQRIGTPTDIATTATWRKTTVYRHTSAEDIIARYAARWSIEITYFDVKNILGVGQARNRIPKPYNEPSRSDCSATAS